MDQCRTGSVTFSNYGWYDHLPTSGVGQPTAGSSTLGPNTIPQFDYQFVADASGVIHYSLTATGPTFSDSKDFLSRSSAEAAVLRRPAPGMRQPGGLPPFVRRV